MRGKLNAGSPDGPQGYWVDSGTDRDEAYDSALALQDLRSRAGEDVAISRSLEGGVISGETAGIRKKTKNAVVKITAQSRGFAGRGFGNMISILGDVPSRYVKGVNFDFVSFDVRKIVMDFLTGLLMEDDFADLEWHETMQGEVLAPEVFKEVLIGRGFIHNELPLTTQSVLDCGVFLHGAFWEACQALDPEELEGDFLSAKQSAEVLRKALKGVNGEAINFKDRLPDLIAEIEEMASIRRDSGKRAKGKLAGGYSGWESGSEGGGRNSEYGELDFD